MSMVERPTVRHLAARTHPEIYRPLVDAALLRVGEFCGADLRGLQRALAPIEVERGGGRLSLGPRGYVEEALCRARPLVMGARLREPCRAGGRLSLPLQAPLWGGAFPPILSPSRPSQP